MNYAISNKATAFTFLHKFVRSMGIWRGMFGFIVGTGVLDCPRKNERFVQNYVDECMLFDRFAMRIFMYSRTVGVAKRSEGVE